MRQPLIGFCTFFGVSLAGYSGTGPWAIGVATLGLLALSYAERQGLVRRAVEAGFITMTDRSLIGSLFNAASATGACYVFGALLRVI